MKTMKQWVSGLGIGILALGLAGCGTAKNGEHFATKYRANDGRTVEIGPRERKDNGWVFQNPHMNRCWIASDFDFKGYDTLYIAPVVSTADVDAQDPDAQMLSVAKENTLIEMSRLFRARKIFANVITNELDIKPGAHTLKLQNALVGLEGDSDARYFWGMFGKQPVIRVAGTMTDGDKTVFSFEARRSGVSVGAHLGIMEGQDIQLEDIRSLSLDVTDFAACIAGIYEPKN